MAAAAHQAREQIRPHKETFNDCIRALSDLAPGGLPVAPSSDDSAVLNARVTTLEAQMNHLAETIKPLERKLAPLDDTLARIESGRKTTEDNLSSTIAQLEKSHEQLNGRVTSLSEQVATSAVPEFRVAIEAENSALKSRLSAVETVIKRRAEGVKDIQEGFNGQSSRLESLESGLRDMKVSIIKLGRSGAKVLSSCRAKRKKSVAKSSHWYLLPGRLIPSFPCIPG